MFLLRVFFKITHTVRFPGPMPLCVGPPGPPGGNGAAGGGGGGRTVCRRGGEHDRQVQGDARQEAAAGRSEV